MTGTVTLINPAGTVNQGVVNYLVRIDLNPTKDPLKIDMTANGRVILDTHRECVGGAGGSDSIRSEGRLLRECRWIRNGRPFRVDVTTGYYRWRPDGSVR